MHRLGWWGAGAISAHNAAQPAIIGETNYSSPLLPCAGSISPNVNRQEGQAYAMSPSTFWSGLILATSSIAILHLGQRIVPSCAVSDLSVIVACILTSI